MKTKHLLLTMIYFRIQKISLKFAQVTTAEVSLNAYSDAIAFHFSTFPLLQLGWNLICNFFTKHVGIWEASKINIL